MHLFDVLPRELFSVLASQNRTIYAQALMTLHEAFQEQLKISEDTFFSMLCSRLENDLSKADFIEDGIAEEENENLSGRARFLIRKLREKGWLDIERGDNFEKYIIVPEYSIRLLELFTWFTTDQAPNGFSYVYESYATLRSSNEEGANYYEKLTALNGTYNKTKTLIKTLKTVYHNINRYFQLQLDLADINQVLLLHFDDFLLKIVEAHIRPLKIKDSVPKYKVPIMNILESWLEDSRTLDEMASAALQEGPASGITAAQHRSDIIGKIFFIKESYERFEQTYLAEIDSKVRRYTRSTMQRIEYLTNNDRTVRGNLIYLLNTLAQQDNDTDTLERTQEIFQLKRQCFISGRSLYTQRRGKKRVMNDPVAVEDVQEDLMPLVKEKFSEILDSPFTREKVYRIMNDMLSKNPVAYTSDLPLSNDEQYILSLLAVLEGDNRSSPYQIELLENRVRSSRYTVPNVRFKKKE